MGVQIELLIYISIIINYLVVELKGRRLHQVSNPSLKGLGFFIASNLSYAS
jgi:hypothetical protein